MGESWAKQPVLKKTGCNWSTTSLFDFWQTGQLATGLITIGCNWQLQSSCDQLWSSPVASLCISCQLDFETLFFYSPTSPALSPPLFFLPTDTCIIDGCVVKTAATQPTCSCA